MQIEHFSIPGPALIRPQKLGDARGYFMETFKDSWFRKNVADVTFVQDNQSMSQMTGTLRGLHFQTAPFGQGKLVRCLSGSFFDAIVDLRKNSATYGQWLGVKLTAEGGEQLWVPDGFAHGFCTLEPNTVAFYKVTNPYSHEHDKGLAFNDPDLGIDWPIEISAVVVSERDRAQPLFRDIAAL